MARFPRVLTAKEVTAAPAVAAPPPEAVALESDLVVTLAVLLCALICVVGLIAAARCAIRRRRSAGGANKGLKKKVLQSLPKFTYTTTSETASSMCDGMKVPAMLSSECPICLGEFVEGVEVRMLPNCGHGFHVACIDKWLGSHSSCPSCRQVVAVGRCGKCGQSVSSATTAKALAESPVNGPLHVTVTVNNAFMP